MVEYPGIARAALLIALDNGGINRDRSVARQRADFERWIARQPDGPLPAIDAWLAALSDHDLEEFCYGGEGEPEHEALALKAPPFTDDLLNTYFDEVC